MRLVGSVGFGLWIVLFVSFAAEHGLDQPILFSDEVRVNWGFLFWGDHLLARSIVWLVAVLAGGFGAGAAARKHISQAGLIVGLISAAAWLFGAYLLIVTDPKQTILPHRGGWLFTCVALALVSPFAARWSASFAQEDHENKADGTEVRIGLRWHWLWIWIPLYFILAEFFFSALLTIRLELAGSGILLTFARVGSFLTALATLYGPYMAFETLSTRDKSSGGAKRFGLVFAYLAVLPGVAILIRTGLLWILFKLSA